MNLTFIRIPYRSPCRYQREKYPSIVSKASDKSIPVYSASSLLAFIKTAKLADA